MTDVINTREIVLAVLTEVLEEDKYSHIVLREVLEKYQYLEKRDRSFITRVAEGTLENLIEMDYIISQFSSVKVSRMKPVIRNILRVPPLKEYSETVSGWLTAAVRPLKQD